MKKKELLLATAITAILATFALSTISPAFATNYDSGQPKYPDWMYTIKDGPGTKAPIRTTLPFKATLSNLNDFNVTDDFDPTVSDETTVWSNEPQDSAFVQSVIIGHLTTTYPYSEFIYGTFYNVMGTLNTRYHPTGWDNNSFGIWIKWWTDKWTPEWAENGTYMYQYYYVGPYDIPYGTTWNDQTTQLFNSAGAYCIVDDNPYTIQWYQADAMVSAV
jgi:hypothetical protein